VDKNLSVTKKMSNLEKAIATAVEAHMGQVDKGGSPYILHPLRVMISLKT
jgi:(p)ppGpp synthase/HD superfamily hydrolase